MVCPRCGSTTSVLQGRCTACGASVADDAPTVAGDSLTQIPTTPPPAVTGSLTGERTAFMPGGPTRGSGPLNVGQNFGSRYHIIPFLRIWRVGAGDSGIRRG